ncbi:MULTISPECIES: cyclase family protein [Vibrio]|uniref:cyclase family protein n=1 Tax=Vibrio TaxID=662 RepID=UPI0001B94ECD|nr:MULTISPECIES: cyclase family protein [Vibrio]AIU68110.1 cyclase [Vibrio coralliilyticus]EEX30743.1 metal-dependent hydrolase [Vibrio coralliilyticus ATCC BAA-450]MCM5509476.1 cyclase family protein [Vibrio sp. SCSIO 43169]MDE3899603.1 cyclase family protein [Vibrio sp. CC007]QFT34978.1 Kynurenine formamidase [Vibrio sp. THAF64]
MKITDLSMVLEEGMQTFAAHWHPFYESTQLGRHGIENRETRKIILGTHTGTHIDAPRHFIAEGETIENISLEQLNGPARIVDFSALPDKHEITEQELRLALGDKCPERLVGRFDWDLKLNSNEYYTDHAFFSEEACQWLVDNGCKVIALDTPQPDNPLNGRGAEKDAPNHKILLGAGVVIVEYLVDIRKIEKEEITLIVAPLKIKDGDGAPARCFAIEEM